MYTVEYKTMEEICEEYGESVLPIDKGAYYECLLTNEKLKIIKFIKLNVPNIDIQAGSLLKVPIRCYIMQASSFDEWVDILKRYG